MTRLWTEAVVIEVKANGGGQPCVIISSTHHQSPLIVAITQGQPLAFQWVRHLQRVTGIANRWRVHTLWWREEIWREYFKVLTDSGLLCTLYHDLLAEHWYLERVYD